MPGASRRIAFTSFAESFFSVSMLTDSEWPQKTGTRTQVAVRRIESSPHAGGGEADRIVAQDLLCLLDHFLLFLGVAAGKEDVDMRDTVKGDLMGKFFFDGLF